MSPVPLDPVAAELYESAGPLTFAEAANGEPLARYAGALGVPLEEIAALSRDSDAGPGWSAFLDPARCPTWALPWLGQFVGVAIPGEVAEADRPAAEAAIRAHTGFARGTPAYIKATVAATLTGGRTVRLYERTPSAYSLQVITRVAETPDPAATCAAARAATPAGIVVECLTRTASTYLDVRGEGTYADVLGLGTYHDLLIL